MKNDLDGRLRSRQINFRVSDYEYELIHRHAEESGAASLREYIISMALNGYIVNVNFDELQKTNYELKKIGNNINQIAHKVNANDIATLNEIRKIQEDWNSIMKIMTMKFCRFS